MQVFKNRYLKCAIRLEFQGSEGIRAIMEYFSFEWQYGRRQTNQQNEEHNSNQKQINKRNGREKRIGDKMAYPGLKTVWPRSICIRSIVQALLQKATCDDSDYSLHTSCSHAVYQHEWRWTVTLSFFAKG